MSGSPFPIRRGLATCPPSRAPRALALFASLTLAAWLGVVPSGSRALPPCDAPDVLERLANALEEIPALAGRDARLLELDAPRARGHAGRHPLRACQGRLVTSAGDGDIEYSIRRTRDGAFAIRPELFQGGWRRELEPADG